MKLLLVGKTLVWHGNLVSATSKLNNLLPHSVDLTETIPYLRNAKPTQTDEDHAHDQVHQFFSKALGTGINCCQDVSPAFELANTPHGLGTNEQDKICTSCVA